MQRDARNSVLRTRKSLTKAEILRKRRDITRVFTKGNTYRTTGLHMRVVENDLSWSRVLVTTTRAFSGAVTRNRARRHLREAYRLVKQDIQGHYDIAFVVYPGSHDFTERQIQVRKLLQRAGLVPPG
ncbi:MAG: ribonuclease P protein component [Alkalispirochaeta sp.]